MGTAVRFGLTTIGGHLDRVRFRLGRRQVEPLATAPWCDEPEAAKLIPLLRVLRGDFFCAPFGAGPAWKGEAHPAHGEPANGKWKILARTDSELCAVLKTRIRQGTLTKTVSARDGETNLYQLHRFEGVSGPMCFGHHAMLDFVRNGPGRLSTSRLRFGQVLPVPCESAAAGGYSSLKCGARIARLQKVPLATGGVTDLSRYPAREGYEDLVMLHHWDAGDFAWAAVVFPEEKFVWFALKNPRLLASTVLWHSNGGRHYPPWNGRHRGVLGIEDVTAYFHLGLGASAGRNPWAEQGIPTCLKLEAGCGLEVPYVMGVAAVPERFDAVASIRRIGGGIRLRSGSGIEIDHAVDHAYLRGDGGAGSGPRSPSG